LRREPWFHAEVARLGTLEMDDASSGLLTRAGLRRLFLLPPVDAGENITMRDLDRWLEEVGREMHDRRWNQNSGDIIALAERLNDQTARILIPILQTLHRDTQVEVANLAADQLGLPARREAALAVLGSVIHALSPACVDAIASCGDSPGVRHLLREI